MRARALGVLAALLALAAAWPTGALAARSQARVLRHLLALQNETAVVMNTGPPVLEGQTYKPVNPGSWKRAGDTSVIYMYGTIMQGGEIIGWQNMYTREGDFGTAVFYPDQESSAVILPECGISDCRNAFCSGQVLTPENELLVFGGHEIDYKDGAERGDIAGFRTYDGFSGKLQSTTMESGRWYPTPNTMPDGKILVVGGVKKNGQTGYFYYVKPDKRDEYDNPTYMLYDPASKTFTDEEWDMAEQLNEAWPVHTYPWVITMPDGGVVVSAGKTLYKYDRTKSSRFTKAFKMDPRPSAPWSYPQTGQAALLPIYPPYDKMYFLAAGGSSKDKADNFTAATDSAHLIELTAGESASWSSVGPMPYSRVLGDATVLCDGSVMFSGGGGVGIAGWAEHPYKYEFKDGTSWDCEWNCTDVYDFHYEPVIYDPATGKWSEKGSLAEAERPRLYHSIAILLPDCRVMTGGGDVSNEFIAEYYSPPYLSKGPRPTINSLGFESAKPGDTLTLQYNSSAPVTKALLLRTGAVTHSMSFDQRALWLEIESSGNGSIALKTPPSGALLPPGMYMVTLLSDAGVPSEAKIFPVFARDDASSTSTGFTDDGGGGTFEVNWDEGKGGLGGGGGDKGSGDKGGDSGGGGGYDETGDAPVETYNAY